MPVTQPNPLPRTPMHHGISVIHTGHGHSFDLAFPVSVSGEAGKSTRYFSSHHYRADGSKGGRRRTSSSGYRPCTAMPATLDNIGTAGVFLQPARRLASNRASGLRRLGTLAIQRRGVRLLALVNVLRTVAACGSAPAAGCWSVHEHNPLRSVDKLRSSVTYSEPFRSPCSC